MASKGFKKIIRPIIQAQKAKSSATAPFRLDIGPVTEKGSGAGKAGRTLGKKSGHNSSHGSGHKTFHR